LFNKCDLTESWELKEGDLISLLDVGVIAGSTSAKTGEGVEWAFLTLAARMLKGKSVMRPPVIERTP
jgi:hypothetical protein